MENSSGSTQNNFFWEIYKWQKENHPEIYKQGGKQ
jgi:hypothetical protein